MCQVIYDGGVLEDVVKKKTAVIVIVTSHKTHFFHNVIVKVLHN